MIGFCEYCSEPLDEAPEPVSGRYANCCCDACRAEDERGGVLTRVVMTMIPMLVVVISHCTALVLAVPAAAKTRKVARRTAPKIARTVPRTPRRCAIPFGGRTGLAGG